MNQVKEKIKDLDKIGEYCLVEQYGDCVIVGIADEKTFMIKPRNADFPCYIKVAKDKVRRFRYKEVREFLND